jgi:hypothetical protein
LLAVSIASGYQFGLGKGLVDVTAYMACALGDALSSLVVCKEMARQSHL